MRVVPPLRGTGLPMLGLLVWIECSAILGCAALQPERERRGPTFLARQYLARGRAAWAAGNEPNARFLIGRAVELDPHSSEALALWQAHWPLDSLPPAAVAARVELVGGEKRDPGVSGGGPASGREERPAREALPGRENAAAARLRLESAAVEIPPPVEAADLRSRFERARAAADRDGLERTGEELLRARPTHLPDLYRVLSAWVSTRIEPAETDARLRDVLASLEFGDPSYLAGKPEDLEDARYLRAYRGRFLDLLGWSAFLRGDMAQAEAALRSAEIEINLRGRGDVTHLRHLASFYERRGNVAKAESYAVAAAAREESGSGEARALAGRLWARRRGGTAGLEARLASEAQRVRREERSAAIAGRLYRPLPIFSAVRADGAALTDEMLRGRVTVLVLWKAECEDCLTLLRDLSARAPWARVGRTGGRGGGAEVVALDIGDSREGQAAADSLPGVAFAVAERPAALVKTTGAARLPLTLVVEPAGFVQYRHAGYPGEPAARERWLERMGWQVESLASLGGS